MPTDLTLNLEVATRIRERLETLIAANHDGRRDERHRIRRGLEALPYGTHTDGTTWSVEAIRAVELYRAGVFRIVEADDA